MEVLSQHHWRMRLVSTLTLVTLLLWLGFIGASRLHTHAAAPASCGVSANPDGSYHFSWLHVAGGKIVDASNCPVTLVGFNTSGIEYGDGVAGYSAARIGIFHQTFNMNLWRLAISPVWWNANAYVPVVQMHYQQWVQQVIGWMEQNGNYVELDPTSYHTIAPAADSDPFCANNNNTPPCLTSQDTPNSPPWTEQQMVAAAQQFWQSIVPLYKNDPAILYDALNEPYAPAFANYQQDLNTMITTIQTLNPQALVFVYANGIDQMVAGTLPDYSQPNLVLDFHPYPDPSNPWQAKFARIQAWIAWIQSHNQAFAIGEWGDPNLTSGPPYADAVLSFVKTDGAATTYYQDHNAIWGDFQLTGIGKELQQEYATLPQLVPSPSASTLPVFDASSGQSGSAVNSLSWSHTTTSNANRLLLVSVTQSNGAASIASVTYGGITLTQVGSSACTGSNAPCTSLWSLTNPASGTNTIIVTLSPAQLSNVLAGAITFSNVDQTSPLGTSTSATGNSTTPLVTLSNTTINQLLLDTLVVDASPIITPGASQTQQWWPGPYGFSGVGSTLPALAGTTTMSWILSQSANWAELAVPINGVSP